MPATPTLTPVIDGLISQSRGEIIRDRIAGILACELSSQVENYGLPDALLPTGVDIGRFITIDDSEFPRIVVNLVRGSYLDEAGQPTKDYGGQAAGIYRYYIDTYTGSASTLQDGGDMIATANLQRMLGVQRAILDDTRYATLGFDNDTDGVHIFYCYTESVKSDIPNVTDNTSDYIAGRLILVVKATEQTSEPSTVAAQIGQTIMTVSENSTITIGVENT